MAGGASLAEFRNKTQWIRWGTPPSSDPPGRLVPAIAGDATTSAMNLLEGTLRSHHPVMLAVPIRAYRFEWQYLIELNGLRVPAAFDCNQFNSDQPWTLGHDYFASVPSRWSACDVSCTRRTSAPGCRS
eukprot:6249321-Prymnesium_polylepis.1